METMLWILCFPSSNVCFTEKGWDAVGCYLFRAADFNLSIQLTWVFSLLYRGRVFLEEIELQAVAMPEFTQSSGYSNAYKDIFIQVNYLWKSEG